MRMKDHGAGSAFVSGRTLLVFTALLTAVGVGAAASCELALGDLPPVAAPDGGGKGGSPGASVTVASSTSSGSGGASASSSSGRAGGASVSSAGSSSGGTGGCCDCDGDGYRSQALCGGDDCDDFNPLVHPGQTMYFAAPSGDPNVGFDYDCSGAPNPEFPTPVDCNLLLTGNCDAGVGFLNAVPPCGDAGEWGTCVPNPVLGPLACQSSVIDANRISLCK
jgi:hypothetical protein